MFYILNDISSTPVSTQAEAVCVMETFVNTCVKIQGIGFKNIRHKHKSIKNIALTNQYTVNDWLNDKTVPRTQKDFLLTQLKIVSPHIDSKDISTHQDYEDKCFVYKGEKTEALGIAYLYNTLVVSFLTDEKWDTPTLKVDKLDKKTEKIVENIVIDRHASSPNHVEIHRRTFENHKKKHGWCGERNQPNESKMYCSTQEEALFLLNTAVKHREDGLCNYDPKNERFIIFPKHLPNTYHGYHYENNHKDLKDTQRGISPNLQQKLKNRMTNIYHLLT